MSDWTTDGPLGLLAAEIHLDAIAHGWYEPDKVRDFDGMLANVHGEVSEALEEWRAGHDYGEIYFEQGDRCGTPEVGVLYGWKPEGIPIELADILIRVLDIAAHHGIDLDHAVRLKIEYNRSRPHRHGGKRS